MYTCCTASQNACLPVHVVTRLFLLVLARCESEVLFLLQAVLSLVQPEAMGGQLLMRPFAVTGLVSLTSPQHLAAVTSWQHTPEEGSNNAQSMLSLVAAILHNPFLLGGASDALVKELLEVSAPSSAVHPTGACHSCFASIHCMSALKHGLRTRGRL